ncbi:MAG: transglutaminase family protein [Candidatus Marinimicrobia bacterium]|nr:transglutaminase family protein [Candidatus Neomarinimicrobiota bacterium]
MYDPKFRPYLTPTFFIDLDNPEVAAFADEHTTGLTDPLEKAVDLFRWVRDDFRYDPYRIPLKPENFKASMVLKQGYGFCITKAVLLTAVARAAGIPARLGFANVRNHLSTDKLHNLMGTDIFYWHGYTELFLNGKWVKATPAFNKSLCERFGFRLPDFDGHHDARFHSLDSEGNLHLEYLADHGSFADLPYKKIMQTWAKHYTSILAGHLAAASSGVLDTFEKDLF